MEVINGKVYEEVDLENLKFRIDELIERKKALLEGQANLDAQAARLDAVVAQLSTSVGDGV